MSCGRRSPSDFSELSPLPQAFCQVLQTQGNQCAPLRKTLTGASGNASQMLLPGYQNISQIQSQPETGLASALTPACAFQITAMSREQGNHQVVSFFEGLGVTLRFECVPCMCGIPGSLYVSCRCYTFHCIYMCASSRPPLCFPVMGAPRCIRLCVCSTIFWLLRKRAL